MASGGGPCEAPTMPICCSVPSQLALGKPISTFISQLAAPLEMPWWKGTSQPAMSLPVTFCDTFLLGCDAFPRSPSVSVSLSSCLPAASLSELAGSAFPHYSKEQQGQPRTNVFAPFSLKTRPCSSSLCPTSSCGLCLPLGSELSGNITVLVTAARHGVARS